MGRRPVKFNFNGLPVELRRIIYDLAADLDPEEPLFVPKKINIRIHSQLRFLPPPPAVAGQQTPEGQFRYDFWLKFVNPSAHDMNFVNQETYRTYLIRYPNTLELRGHHSRSDIVRFNASVDTFQTRDGRSLLKLADFAIPIGDPVGLGGISGQGPSALLRSQQLLGFELIQRLEWAHHGLLKKCMAGPRWLQANIITGLTGTEFFDNNLMPVSHNSRTALEMAYHAELANIYFNLPLAWQSTRIVVLPDLNSYDVLVENRFDFIRAFHLIPAPPILPGVPPV